MFMEEALLEAEKAYNEGEIPVGCVIVKSGKIISSAYNMRETTQNAVMHAEIAAIEQACKYVNSWRLNDCDLYVTLEPCAMCAGAIMNARLRRVYFGAYDLNSGALGSAADISQIKGFNHKLEVYGGICEDECSEIITKFFKERRR